VPDEDPEKRRLRRLAETAGSLAPSRMGPSVTPGRVPEGGSWSDVPLAGRIALVALLVALAALVVLVVVVAARDGRTGVAAVVAGVVVLAVGGTVSLCVRRRAR
jgi:hypothetical protein